MADLSATETLSGVTAFQYDDTRGLLYLTTSSGVFEAWNPITQTVVGSVTLGGTPGGFALTPDGQYAIVGLANAQDANTDNIDKIDLSTLTSQQLSVSTPAGTAQGIYEIAIDQSGIAIFSSTYSDFDRQGHLVEQVQLNASSLLAQPIPGVGNYAPGQFVTAATGSDDVLIKDNQLTYANIELLDPVTGTYTVGQSLFSGDPYAGASVPTGPNYTKDAISSTTEQIVDIAWGNTKVYDFNFNLVADLTSKLPGPNLGPQAYGAEFSANGHQLFVWSGQNILVFDTQMWTEVGSIALTNSPGAWQLEGEMAASSDGRFLFLGDGWASTAGFSQIDLSAQLQLTIRGDGVHTQLYGAAGDDLIIGTSANETMDGGGGINTVSYNSASAGVTVSLALQGSAQNTIGAGSDTLLNFQNLIGSAFADHLTGDASNNVLDGGQGDDTLTGGGGADTFVYKTGYDHDVITDFSHAQGDKIDFSGVVPIASLADVQAHAVQSGPDTVITTGSGSLTLQNVLLSSLSASDFIFQGSYSPIAVNGAYTVDVASSPVFTGSSGGLGAYNLIGSATLTIDGNVLVQDGLANDAAVAGIHTNDTFFTPTAEIAAGATFAVMSYGAGSEAYGFISDMEPAAVVNAGAMTVTAVSNAEGIALARGGSIDNSGSLTVTSNAVAIGLDDENLSVLTTAGLSEATSSLENSGTITVTGNLAIGVQLDPATQPTNAGLTFVNSGVIHAIAAAQFGSQAYGISIGASSVPDTVINTGSIISQGGPAIGSAFGDAYQLDLINTGAIVGAIDLGTSGSNLYDGRGGTQTGGIYLGGGHDTVYLGNDGETVYGGSGSANITGGTGADTISGVSGNDILYGGGGSDTLTGSAGADIFIFAPGSDGVVTDFSDAQGDRINLAAFSSLRTFNGVHALLSQSGPNTVLSLPGGGTVTLDGVSASSLSQADFILGSASSDLFGAGSSNIAWENTSGTIVVWSINGQTLSGAALPIAVPGWQLQDTGDFNGDGKSGDLLFRSTSGQVAIWEMNGTQIQSSALVAAIPTFWNVEGTADFNGDGKSDILWRNTNTGDVVIWTMNGTQIQSSAVVATIPTYWHIVGTGDFNGDGKADILWRDSNTGDVDIWTMNGTQIQSSAVVATIPAYWHIEGTGDFDGDGKTDILWQNSNTGDVVVWTMNGAQIQSSAVVATIPTYWHIIGTGDFNGDGKTDILWQNSDSGQTVAWTMNGAAYTSSFPLASVDNSWTALNHHYDWV